MNKFGKFAIAVLLGSTALSAAARADDDDHRAIEHVLLISVDGMHEVDLQRYVKGHPTSAFAKLLRHGVHYTNAHTSRPSDSFPGLLAFMTGASPKTHGVFYDDTYDQTLYPPGSN
ncbi:alkaline phosphatase family protein [Bradyrhizobium sp. 2S1]|uniref:alkaline phosphatase family protein n=1 Tax=Bradyrhizobium sp. 2S1 TaxID=1404429 RepID=UPI001CD05D18|nr:alkaline phosphatase family protein [Bradyrhizobium sp. 2S1]MCK7670437.1 alkaline phosphatase family protein [Bradyrhizobium sp. 2S1]